MGDKDATHTCSKVEPGLYGRNMREENQLSYKLKGVIGETIMWEHCLYVNTKLELILHRNWALSSLPFSQSRVNKASLYQVLISCDK